MSDLSAEIAAVLDETARIWNTQDYARLKTMWDTDDDEPFYLAEEQDDWVFGWPALEKYWVPVPGKRSVEALMMRYYKVRAKQIAPDLALAAFWVRHDMKMSGPVKAWGGDARVTAVFRRKPEGWRFVSYTEACMTPLIYIQKLMQKLRRTQRFPLGFAYRARMRFLQRLYENNLSPDFAGFHREIMELEGRRSDTGG